MKHITYRCHVVGREVQPIGVGEIETVNGKRYLWWSCPVCDRNEKTRSQAGFDRLHPGCHVAWLDYVPPPPVYRLRYVAQETQA